MKDPLPEERMQRHQSGRHVLDLIVGIHMQIVSGGRWRLTRKRAFMLGVSWSAMIRSQASDQYITRRLYHHHGAVVDAFKRPVDTRALVAGQPYTIEPYHPFQPGVA